MTKKNRKNWYQLQYTSTPRAQTFCKKQTLKKQILLCRRCEKPISIYFQTHSLLWDISRTKTYCETCMKRDFYLIHKVRKCIRMLGGDISYHELLSLYDDAHLCRNLQTDPFLEARKLYSGSNKLQLIDIQNWVNEGIFKKTSPHIQDHYDNHLQI